MLNVNYEIHAPALDPKIVIRFTAQEQLAPNTPINTFTGTLTLCDQLVSQTKLVKVATAVEGLLGPTCRPNFLVSPIKRVLLDTVTKRLDEFFKGPVVCAILAANIGILGAVGYVCGAVGKKILGGAAGGPTGAAVGAGIGAITGLVRAYRWNQRKNELGCLADVLVLACRYDAGTATGLQMALGMARLSPLCDKVGGAAALAYLELVDYMSTNEPAVLRALDDMKSAGIHQELLSA